MLLYLLPGTFCTGWLTLHLTENVRRMIKIQGSVNANELYLAILKGIHISKHHVVPNKCMRFLFAYFTQSVSLQWRLGTTLISEVSLDVLASTSPDGG